MSQKKIPSLVEKIYLRSDSAFYNRQVVEFCEEEGWEFSIIADQTGFYFQTGTIKELYNQLKTNPKAEVCFYTPGQMIGTMLRIAGEIEFVDDKQLKEKVIAERPFLKEMGLTSESPNLIIFRIAHGEAHFWTMATNLTTKEIIRF